MIFNGKKYPPIEKEPYTLWGKITLVFAGLCSLAAIAGIILMTVLLGGCSKEVCWECQATDTATNTIIDQEDVCGLDNKDHYILTWEDAATTVYCE